MSTWIFGDCQDIVGSCIRYIISKQRQYIIFGISLIISLLAFFSCYKTYKIQNRITYQFLPLFINTLTSLIMFGFYTQLEYHNIRFVLLVVQFYSYFILCYGFIAMVIKQATPSQQSLNLIRTLFISITVASIVAIVVFGFLECYEILGCEEDQGIGSIVMVVVQLLLIIFTYYYSSKFKKILRQNTTFHRTNYQNNPSLPTQHLINQEDQYLSLKKCQLNLVRFALIFNFALHLAELLLFYIVDDQKICQDGNLVIKNRVQLTILWLQNISQLFPHFMIPFIFWYLPLRISARANTVFISSTDKSKQVSSQSSDGKPLPKLNMGRQQSQYYQDMHNEDSIKQKLVSKIKTNRTSTL